MNPMSSRLEFRLVVSIATSRLIISRLAMGWDKLLLLTRR